MDVTKGEAVQQCLWAFLEHTASEPKPTSDGWELFHELERAVSELGDDYDSLTPHLPKPEVASTPVVQPTYDNWFIEVFDRINGGSWNRQPGDRLRLRQMIDIAGQIFLVVLLVGLVIFGVGYLMIHLQEWQIGRYR